MAAYIVRRLLSGLVALFLLSIVVFLLLRVLAGDQVVCVGFCNEDQIRALRERLGLNDSYVQQYLTWLKDLATGHLGHGSLNQQPVLETMRHRLPVTLELLIITVLFTVAIGVPFGVVSALFRNTPADYVLRFVSIMGLAVPTFWVGTLVIFLPSQWWHYAPPLGASISFFNDPMGNLRQYVPPAAVLGLASSAAIMRLTRSSLLEVMRTDYIRTARAKGLRGSVIVSRHALKNSMIPVVTVLGLQVAGLMAGSVIIEQVFALPGIGKLILESLVGRQFQLTQSLALYVGACVILMNIIVDISYAWLDPRIRYG